MLLKFYMKEATRQIALNLILFLSLLNLGVFLTMMICGMVMKARFKMVLGLIQGLKPNFFYNLVTYGAMSGSIFSFLQLFVAWLNVFVTNRRLGNSLLKLFSLLNLTAIVGVFYLITSANQAMAIIHKNMQTSFKEVMAEYMTVPSTRTMLDQTQQYFKCCGYSSYNDWFAVDWIRGNHQRDGQNPKDTTPYSCCDPLSPRPCVFFNVRSNDHDNYDYNKDLTLFKQGCENITSTELSPFFESKIKKPAFVLFPSLFLCFFLSRYVATSISGGIAKGHPAMAAYGYLLSFGGDPMEVATKTTKKPKMKKMKVMKTKKKLEEEPEDEEAEEIEDSEEVEEPTEEEEREPKPPPPGFYPPPMNYRGPFPGPPPPFYNPHPYPHAYPPPAFMPPPSQEDDSDKDSDTPPSD